MLKNQTPGFQVSAKLVISSLSATAKFVKLKECLTYSLTSKYLSPSLATHRPRLLMVEPLKVIGCCSPD